MAYTSFDKIISDCAARGGSVPMAVVCAEDENTLTMVENARKAGLGRAILIGREERIRELLPAFPGIGECRIVNSSIEDAPQTAVDLIHTGEAAVIVKGHIETAPLMHAVVKKENAMIRGGVLSHLTILAVPRYPKLLGITDCAMMPYPDVEKKAKILENALELYERLGYESVKAAILAAAEKVNPKMPESIDAARIAEMAREGRFGNAIVEGPLSYDIATSPDAARQKEYGGRISGDADLLLVPNLTTGNVLLKSLVCSAGAEGAGIVLGGKVPIVLTSRSSSAAAKLRSLAMALLTAEI